MGRAEKIFLFKERICNIDVILGGKKMGVSTQKLSGKIKKIKIGAPKKWSGDFFFLIKKFYHGKIEATNPSSIK